MSEMELKYCLEERVAWLVIGKAGSNWTDYEEKWAMYVHILFLG